MKYSILIALLFSISSLYADDMQDVNAELTQAKKEAAMAKEEVAVISEELAQTKAQREKDLASLEAAQQVLKENSTIHISVIGQGVAPMNTISPAQAYALAKRAAIADAYRAIAEKVKGVRVDGEDTIKNMMVKRSTIRTYVQAMVKNANVVETTFKEGLCEVEMEIILSHSDFAH